MNTLEFLKENTVHVLPILAAGVFGLAIVIERAQALFRAFPLADAEGFFDRITELVTSDKLAEAIGLCDRYPGKPVAQVTKQALLRAHQPESLIESGLVLVVGETAKAIQKRTQFLAMIANVATLLGLLGTILGLVDSFEALGAADAQQKSALLATGISQAMYATMLGLAVAIPCMVAFSFLMNRTQQLVAEVDGAAARAFDILRQRYYSIDVEALAPALASLTAAQGKSAKAGKSGARPGLGTRTGKLGRALAAPHPELDGEVESGLRSDSRFDEDYGSEEAL